MAPPAELTTIPLEIRHKIFEHAAVRDYRPKKVLRHWFEKTEVAQIIAKQTASSPDGVAPRGAYQDDDEDSEVAEQEGHGEEDEDDIDDDEQEDDGEDDDNMQEDEDNAEDAENEDVDMDDGAGEADETMADGDGVTAAAAAAAAQTTPPVPVVHPARKWRHIPNFMRITHCPPPVELFLVSKALSKEAKDWFYDVAVLRIEATASFAHTSFFEEAFEQVTNAAFSPMENIRKVQVTFVWDTAWLRANNSEAPESIFQALLRSRAEFIVKILKQAPELQSVEVHWHDSLQDDESTRLKYDILDGFTALLAKVDIKDHYIAPDAKPHAKSIAGKRRVEFQNILDNGLERLF
ncbi:hypothetical protein BDV95DRAFT_480970 [Massariosphaeria phaeospora]|uniref:Uncharacterized protein n=1 Tax=Massariosphaeria phaeospora TaxID=100035 RepID=A0A7C8IIX2_9PLEO|nr:hypothetical protein BDV95DRAFT_480970 [Massariosphaeria phaeospora]